MVPLPCTLDDWAALGIVGQVHYGQRATALPYAKAIEKKTNAALELITRWWDAVEGQGYIALSFGKDSLVTWHLAQQVAAIPAMFVALGPLADWPDCLALKKILLADYALDCFEVPAIPSQYEQLVLNQRPGHHTRFSTCGETAERLRQEQPWWRGCLWGLRGVNEPQREGIHREILFATHGLLYQRKADAYWMGAPVGYWKASDIWAYIDLHNLPYAAMYDIDRYGIRNGSLFTLGGEALGRVRKFRIAFPQIFRIVSAAMPEGYTIHA